MAWEQNNERVEITATVDAKRSTEKAWKIIDQRSENGDTVIWLPKSEVELSHYHDADKGVAVLLVPLWLVQKKGLER